MYEMDEFFEQMMEEIAIDMILMRFIIESAVAIQAPLVFENGRCLN